MQLSCLLSYCSDLEFYDSKLVHLSSVERFTKKCLALSMISKWTKSYEMPIKLPERLPGVLATRLKLPEPEVIKLVAWYSGLRVASWPRSLYQGGRRPLRLLFREHMSSVEAEQTSAVKTRPDRCLLYKTCVCICDSALPCCESPHLCCFNNMYLLRFNSRHLSCLNSRCFVSTEKSVMSP